MSPVSIAKQPHSLRSTLVLALLLCTISTAAQELRFSPEQLATGAEHYQRECASCHGDNLGGLGVVPAVAGPGFMARWAGAAPAELLTQIERMPPDRPGSLLPSQTRSLLAFILASNGLAQSDTQMTEQLDLTALRIPAIDVERPPLIATVLETFGGSVLLDGLEPVTAQALDQPSANDWLSWHRSNDSEGFAPLDQIDTDNVNQLSEVWRLPLPPGNNNPTPLVHDGVMFFYTFPDTVMAIDAASGSVLWRYQHELAIPATRKMGIALHGDKVLVPTSDMRIVALSAKTGELIWEQAIATQLEVVRGPDAYDLRAAPTIAGDVLIQGVVGSFVLAGSFIVGMDVESGEELWRFHTLARPGEPGGDTWNDLPLEERGGGSVWIPGSYEPDLNLVYFGVAPTYHTQKLTHAIDKPGVSNDALYTNSTIALNPQTGELVWHYQHMPNDQWDLDWAFERQIMDLEFEGEQRKVVLNIGKSAILEALDAATGDYLFSVDMGLQNIISAIDPETGAKTVNPNTTPRREGAYDICPNAVGARSWPPASYNPRSKQLFVPLTEGCFKAGSEGNELLLTGIPVQLQAHPDSADGQMGRIQAIDLATQQMSWRHRQPRAVVSSVLSTAGGVLFAGDLEPSLKALDQATGELLWSTALDDDPSAGLISYAVDGRQYIAVVVGQSNNHVRDWSGIAARYAETEGWVLPPRGEGKGSAIVVFALDRN